MLSAASELFMEAPLGFSGIVKADDEILQSEWLRLWARWLLGLTLKARPPGSLLLSLLCRTAEVELQKGLDWDQQTQGIGTLCTPGFSHD